MAAASALQLYYDSRITAKIDRNVFVGQFVNAQLDPRDTAMLLRSIPKTISVTAEVIFNTITEQISNETFQNVHSVVTDTTALNTGKNFGINIRLEKYFITNIGHDIHTLECMFHLNEIYLTHVISMVEGIKKVLKRWTGEH